MHFDQQAMPECFLSAWCQHVTIKSRHFLPFWWRMSPHITCWCPSEACEDICFSCVTHLRLLCHITNLKCNTTRRNMLLLKRLKKCYLHIIIFYSGSRRLKHDFSTTLIQECSSLQRSSTDLEKIRQGELKLFRPNTFVGTIFFHSICHLCLCMEGWKQQKQRVVGMHSQYLTNKILLGRSSLELFYCRMCPNWQCDITTVSVSIQCLH